MEVSGTARGIGMGAILRPWLLLRGDPGFSRGKAEILVSDQGTFAWGSQSAKRVSVYIQTEDGTIRSNVVPVRAR